jgi:hypothetical protein
MLRVEWGRGQHKQRPPYEALIGEAESGNEVLIESPDGTKKLYRKIF